MGKSRTRVTTIALLCSVQTNKLQRGDVVSNIQCERQDSAVFQGRRTARTPLAASRTAVQRGVRVREDRDRNLGTINIQTRITGLTAYVVNDLAVNLSLSCSFTLCMTD